MVGDCCCEELIAFRIQVYVARERVTPLIERCNSIDEGYTVTFGPLSLGGHQFPVDEKHHAFPLNPTSLSQPVAEYLNFFLVGDPAPFLKVCRVGLLTNDQEVLVVTGGHVVDLGQVLQKPLPLAVEESGEISRAVLFTFRQEDINYELDCQYVVPDLSCRLLMPGFASLIPS